MKHALKYYCCNIKLFLATVHKLQMLVSQLIQQTQVKFGTMPVKTANMCMHSASGNLPSMPCC